MSLERISGPWQGLYVASYTTEYEGLFFGYAKVCQGKPADAWTADTIVKLCAGGFTDELHALIAADLCGQAVAGSVREVLDLYPWVRRVIAAPSLVQRTIPTSGAT